jgi:serine/threonine protein kinase/TM2 domain-containing membrane protein YozV
MQRYMYQHGDRPLEGYTIQRAAGRGGFGEVYYALSDSGREVALKVVQNYEQIELRGITQCMNLKSPHLVTVFDVKYNDKGQPFVIMEYVSGPSLRTLISESPGGLGKQKAAFFLREIAKGLSYLHECGIVHRDLKPGNIFYENGYVKICDYGLTKAISASRHSGNTITVGTVHYMAPEIGAGKYNFGIDIYALGVLLYEMLTGDVPFLGESPAEILMKHMTSEPELKNIDEPFAHVIKKAMAKDPDARYQTVQEMVEDLFGEDNIRNSVSHFAPEELSVIAQKVAAKANIGDSPKAYTPHPGSGAAPQKPYTPANDAKADNQFNKTVNNIYEKVDKIGEKIAVQVDTKIDHILGGQKTRIPGVTDPIQPAQRHTLAFISTVIVAAGAGFLQSHNGSNVFTTAFAVFIMTNVCANLILTGRKHWFANIEPESIGKAKVLLCAFAAFVTSWIAIIFLKNVNFFAVYLALFLPMLFTQWHRMALPDRQKRLSLGTALWSGILGAVTGAIFIDSPIVIGAVLAGASLFVQAASAFGQTSNEQPIRESVEVRRENKKIKKEFNTSVNFRIVPRFVRIIFLIGSFLSLGFGLFLLILAGTSNLRGESYAMSVGFGINGLLLSLFLLIGFCRSKFNGWYRYIIKPLILLISLFVLIISSVYMGCMNLRNDSYAVALFFIIFSAITFILVLIIPARAILGDVPKPINQPIPHPQAAPGISAYKRTTALILSILGLFGFHGIQRFYVGKIGTGILWFFTFGLLGIGQLIDVIMILSGSFRDRYGLPLLIWNDKTELKNKASFVPPPAHEYKVQQEYKEPLRQNQPASPEPAPIAPEPPASYAPSSTIVYEPFHPFEFLCSGLGFIFILLAIGFGIAMGLRIPNFIAAGWPNPQLSTQLEQLFGYPEWPGLAVKLSSIIFVALLLLSGAFMAIGRRYSGIRHILRIMLGLCGIYFAFQYIFNDISSEYHFGEVQLLLNSKLTGPAFEKLFSGLNEGEVILGAFIFLVSIIILAWPPRRKQTMIVPPINQGVN